MAGEVGLKQGALPITQAVSAAFGGGGWTMTHGMHNLSSSTRDQTAAEAQS